MFYQESKTAKGAAIGTIMPWGGGITSIPKGWIICDGQYVDASAYPLLTQTIGDTYNTGTSSLAGSFPSYTGTLKMPNLNDKALMDVEEAYFTGGGSPTGRVADEDIDARTLLSTKIGTHESQSIVTSFTDVFTDIVFTLPATDATGYQGKIAGNTKIDGEGFHTVYIAPRKLGRKHIKRHTHTGTYDTIGAPSATQPGEGVIPFGEVAYTIRMSAFDNIGDDDAGDTYYWGWTDDAAHGNGTAQVFTAPAISVGTRKAMTASGQAPGDWATNNWFPASAVGTAYTGNTYGSQDHLYQLWWPDANMTDVPDGIDGGSFGVVLAKVESTPPPYDLTPRFVTDTPISAQFKQSTSHPMGARISSDYNVKYADGGGELTIPTGYRNYYIPANVNTVNTPTTLPYLPGGTINPDTDSALRGTLMSHPGYNFVTEGDANDKIFAHTHDDFDVEFDSSRLKARSSLTANVNIPTQTDFLGNAENRNALQIDFNVSQPQMTCVYIIRAY